MSDLVPTPEKNYSCQLKWNEVSMNLHSKSVASCCRCEWYSYSEYFPNNEVQDPTAILNIPPLIADRELMLAGGRPKGCSICWELEDKNTPSFRIPIVDVTEPRYTQSKATAMPKLMMVSFHNYCSLSCVYCCLEYSSSWYADIKENGPYFGGKEVRFTIQQHDTDKFRNNKLNTIQETELSSVLDTWVDTNKLVGVEELYISGGEPLMDMSLPARINKLAAQYPNIKICFITGLGLNDRQFENFINTVKPSDKIRLELSQESMGATSELIRYGLTWSKWEERVLTLAKLGFNIRFRAAVSSIAIFGLSDFIKWGKSKPELANAQFRVVPVTYPTMFSIQHLGKSALTDVIRDLSVLTDDATFLKIDKFKEIIDASPVEPNKEQLTVLKEFMSEFARRRNISLDKSMPSQLMQLFSDLNI